MRLLRTFGQAFAIVACVAANTTFIARGEYQPAFIVGFLISYLWWGNARTASLTSSRIAQIVYGLGAATGTVVGMYLARL